MNNPADEISQAEKRRILAEDRRGRTYMGHAMTELDDAGGRYAKVNTTIVNGCRDSTFGRLNGKWNKS